MKAAMAITGLILIGFLLMHMYGNLKMFLGAEEFDLYAEWLKGDILSPALPPGTFIWIFRVFLVTMVVLHLYSAFTLWSRAKAATPSSYKVRKTLSQTYSARTMRWGGVILAGFLIFHLAQFTVHSALVSGSFATTYLNSPYRMVIGEFQNWWLVLLYGIWIAIVTMHVRHGFWSAFTTLGANTSPKARTVLNGCAWAVAVLLFIGFMTMPVAVLFGWIH